jgi:hypothetical protein
MAMTRRDRGQPNPFVPSLSKPVLFPEPFRRRTGFDALGPNGSMPD